MGSYHIALSARPLKRAIQRMVQDQLAMRLLNGDFGDGDTVLVDEPYGELTSEKVLAVESAKAESRGALSPGAAT